MANLTISIDDELLHKSRIAALERHTSLNELLRSYMETLASSETAARISMVEELRASFATSSARVGDITWTRDDLHERG